MPVILLLLIRVLEFSSTSEGLLYRQHTTKMVIEYG